MHIWQVTEHNTLQYFNGHFLEQWFCGDVEKQIKIIIIIVVKSA